MIIFENYNMIFKFPFFYIKIFSGEQNKNN